MGPGRREVGENGADIESGGGRPHQQGRIDGRLVDGQQPKHAIDIHTVSDLEQPVGNGIPVIQHMVVVGQAKLLDDTEDALRSLTVYPARGCGHLSGR